MTPMTDAELHAFNHDAILFRLRQLVDGNLSGRRLVIVREMFAFSVLGHDMVWPECDAVSLIPPPLRLPV